LTHPRTSANSPQPTDIRQKAKDKLEWILAEHQPEPLKKDVQDELTSILAAAEREIGK
jgi:trimethylamine:corrinoid methyltransferase-like protein